MSKTYTTLPEGLSWDDIEAAVRESLFGLGTAGFCLECGAERDGCEPDAENYECYDCGNRAVFGAETILASFA